MRIVVGKWECNNGQACITPNYIITTKSLARIGMIVPYGREPNVKNKRCQNNRRYGFNLEECFYLIWWQI